MLYLELSTNLLVSSVLAKSTELVRITQGGSTDTNLKSPRLGNQLISACMLLWLKNLSMWGPVVPQVSNRRLNDEKVS